MHAKLFEGFAEEEIKNVLKCLNAVEKSYDKDAYIFRAGEQASALGVILSGAVQVVSEDYWGERQIMGIFTQGQLFGESYACMEKTPLMVSAVAAEPSQILFIDAFRVFKTCSSACEFHRRLIVNLVSILAGKNLVLTRKIEHISKKTIRGKVLAYLSDEAGRQGGSSVELPYNRQQLADYLSVDRSALSAELSRMQREGLISYKKNHFILHKEMEG